MTPAGACATLGQIQFESAFRANNAEDSKGIADEVYTAQVDSGQKTRHQFSYDGVGYGYAQWTEPTRKGRMYDFHKSRKTSIGDSETQIQYLLWEMKNYFPNQWKLVTSSSDLKSCTWELLDKWENPKEKTNNMANRYQAAQNFFKMFSALTLDSGSSAMTADEAIAKVLEQARAELGYHEKRRIQILTIRSQIPEQETGPNTQETWLPLEISITETKMVMPGALHLVH